MNIDLDFMAGYIVALIMLVIASYMDLRAREIDPRVWIPFIMAAAIIAMLRIYLNKDQGFLFYILLSMIPPAVLFVLGLFGMMGLADPVALAVVSLLIPTPLPGFVLPPSMVVLVLASISMLFLLVIPMIIINTPRLGDILRLCGSRYLVALVALTGFPIDVKRFLGSKFLYPLIYPSLGEDKITWICRGSFEIEEDPGMHREALARLLEKGYVSGDDIIYVTWGVPYIVFILLGVLLYPAAAGSIEGFIGSIYRWFNP